jgi:hypothetical protein
MKLVRANTSIPVPEVHGYACAACESPAQWPFILMSKAEGVQLNWKKIPLEGRRRIMEQLAEVVFQLSHLSFDQIGSIVSQGDTFSLTRCVRRSFPKTIDAGPFRSTRAYYETLLSIFREDVTSLTDSSRLPFLRPIPHLEDFNTIDEYRTAVSDYNDLDLLHGPEPWNSRQNIAYYERLHQVLNDALIDLVDFDSHVFVLEHPDLNPSNIFIDPDTFELRCIIDWERASTVPIEALCVPTHLPNRRGPLDNDLQLAFADSFCRVASTDDGSNQENGTLLCGLMRRSKSMWAFDKLVQRDTHTYFHYAVDQFLTWKLGDQWRQVFESL